MYKWINVFPTMLDYCWKKKKKEKKRQANLEETKAQLFVIIDLFELA